ncbi:MAG: hypothetical protein CMN77_18980 [Spirochaetaceae bacterium]|nr:hypothetical protein [Spirochaetaceae bacterium]|tara:strand:+ start:6574 stop:7914 length:1341 start_codon:yes stop_codon:yes gene_type:complete
MNLLNYRSGSGPEKVSGQWLLNGPRSLSEARANSPRENSETVKLWAALFLSLISLLSLVAPLGAETENPADEKIIEGRQENPNLPNLSVLMEWTSVKIAQEYIFQVADLQGRVLIDRKGLKEPSVEVKLKPGRYQRRIGIVNKFGKVSFWSPWETFRLVKTEDPRMQELTLGDHTPGQSTRVIVSGENLDEFTEFEASSGKKKVKIWRKQLLPDGKVALDVDTSSLGNQAEVDIEAKNPGRDPDRVESALIIDGDKASVGQPSIVPDFDLQMPTGYTWLIPGYNQFERGETWKGYLISGGILFFGAASLYYANEANGLASAATDDFSYQVLSNPLLYNAVVPNLSTNEFNALRADQYFQSDVKSSQYNTYKNNSYVAAGIAGLIYAYHLWDVFTHDSPDGLALVAEPRSLKPESGAPFKWNSVSAFSPEQRRLTETYMGAGYQIHF